MYNIVINITIIVVYHINIIYCYLPYNLLYSRYIHTLHIQLILLHNFDVQL